MKLVFLIALVCIPAALAQTPGPSAPQSPVLSTRTTLVLVPALIRTRNGEPVSRATSARAPHLLK